jgi:predicted choloylglycine hydrolase
MSNANPAPAQVVELEGDHYRMGLQHGQQVLWLRRYIVEAIEARFAQVARDRPDEAFETLVQETRRVVQIADPATIDFVRGQAESLELDFDWLLRYNFVNFLRDALIIWPGAASVQPGECTTWAAAGPATADGQPILVKNRDYRLDHLPLQVVVRAEPASGYGYIYVTSAGNPGVFVAGLNAAGLAVADTHVPCPDVGPGLPTFALSMHLLEEQDTVASALNYLQRIPRLGRNNLLLVDACGDMALFENGHSRGAVVRPEADILVATNHFRSPSMKDCFVDTEPPALQGNTFERYRKVKEALSVAHGRIDLAVAKALMASHDGPLASLCRHPLPESTSSTISTTILLPAQRRIHFCHGQPCQAAYTILECPSETNSKEHLTGRLSGVE